jgi:hypothetical protein
MPLRAACDAMARGVCLDLRYRGEFLCVEVHAAGYDQDSEPLVYGWQRAGLTEGGWRLIRLADAEAVEDSGYFSEAPRPGYSLDKAISKVVCEV